MTTDPHAPAGAVPAVTARLCLTISYDGAGFRGFAVQPGQRTVAGVLGEAIAVVVGHRVELVCAGRTDAGVHARGQVVHVDVGEDTDARPPGAVGEHRLLKPSVVIRVGRRRPARVRRPPLGPGTALPVPRSSSTTPRTRSSPRCRGRCRAPSTCRAMAAAADALLGEHDFRAFCRRVPGDRGRDSDHAAGARRPLQRVPVRPGELGIGRPSAAVRHRGHLVLPPDGPLGGGDPGRGGPGPAPRRRTSTGSSRAATGPG